VPAKKCSAWNCRAFGGSIRRRGGLRIVACRRKGQKLTKRTKNGQRVGARRKQEGNEKGTGSNGGSVGRGADKKVNRTIGSKLPHLNNEKIYQKREAAQ